MLSFLSLWFRRIIGSFSCAFFDALSVIQPLYLIYGMGGYYGAPTPPAKAELGELPAGGTMFSVSLFALRIARRRFR